MPADARGRNNFGSLRILFATLVIVSHSPELIDGNRSREILSRIFGTMSFGELAVDGFFVISGYLITKSFAETQSIATYLSKRALRIYPGFAVAYLLCVLMSPLVGGNLAEASGFRLARDVLFLLPPVVPGAFGGVPYPSLNGSMWTISYEFRCYLATIVFGLFFARYARAGYVVVLTIACVLYAVRDQLHPIPGTVLFLGFPSVTAKFLFIFLVGGAFYIWRDRIVLSHNGALGATAALGIAMYSRVWAEPAVAVFGGYLIIWFAFACPVTRVSTWTDRIDPSYGIYLYAWPLQNLLVFFITGLEPWVVTTLTVPGALLAGLLSWHLVEKPALRTKGVLARLSARSSA